MQKHRLSQRRLSRSTQVDGRREISGPVLDNPEGNTTPRRPCDRKLHPVRIVHLINDLSIGGAEMMLYKLLSRTDREHFDPFVISLNGSGKLGNMFTELNIPVQNIDLKSLPFRSLAMLQLVRITRRLKPDLIQGWMYHGNVAAQLAATFVTPRVSVLWNIRQSLYSLGDEKPATARTIRFGAYLSPLPARIINNSHDSVSQHKAIGYDDSRTVVIPNGFDTESFSPSASARLSVRAELGIPLDAVVVGRFGRYHKTKDHETFLRAAALILKNHPATQFLLAGKDIDWNNGELRSLAQQLGLVERIHLLGERLDMPRLTSALDVAVSSSQAEGFPNVIGEAMACAVPCVVTDVGDSRRIVGEPSQVVPSRQPEMLSLACEELIGLGVEARRQISEVARRHIIANYSLKAVVEQYESLYHQVFAERSRSQVKRLLQPHPISMGSKSETSTIGSQTEVC